MSVMFIITDTPTPPGLLDLRFDKQLTNNVFLSKIMRLLHAFFSDENYES